MIEHFCEKGGVVCKTIGVLIDQGLHTRNEFIVIDGGHHVAQLEAPPTRSQIISPTALSDMACPCIWNSTNVPRKPARLASACANVLARLRVTFGFMPYSPCGYRAGFATRRRLFRTRHHWLRQRSRTFGTRQLAFLPMFVTRRGPEVTACGAAPHGLRQKNVCPGCVCITAGWLPYRSVKWDAPSRRIFDSIEAEPQGRSLGVTSEPPAVLRN